MISQAARRRIKKVILWMEVLFILVLGAAVGVVLGAFYQMNKLLPPDAALEAYRPAVGTKIYSSDRVLLAKLAVENREPVSLDAIPKNLRDAVVAIEDSRFYTHSGLDLRGLVRAVWSNVTSKDMSGQGGSTITQQLARNIFLSKRKKLSRKIKEMLLAIQIERNWTKRQILEAYLNQVYFGAGAYGVKSAAQVYFGKELKKLTLEEAAMLAGLPQRPSDFDPYMVYEEDRNYNRTKFRRNDVLDRMATLGYITPDQAKTAKARPIKLRKSRPPSLGYFKAKYFVQHVVDQLRERYGKDVVNKAGLEVVTTLNWKMQQAGEKAAREGIARYRGWGRVTEAALVCLDPNNGYIRVMVGGVNDPWEKHQFNCATQARRQPGSSFKAFVYATALERGRSPYSTVNASAYIRLPDGKVYAPKNHGKYGGRIGYVPAFAGSVNGAAVNLGVEVGLRNVVEMARLLGLKGRLLAYPSLALGVCEATPLEMASAYGVFAADGRHVEPTAIIQVRSQDGVEAFPGKITDTGLSQRTLDGMDTLTRAVVTSGTGKAAAVVPDAHGKTGTTEDNTDAWFVGYTKGGLATAVWAGNRNSKSMSHSLYGGTICAPIWASFMQKAVALNPAAKKQVKAVQKPQPERRRRERPRPVAGPVTADEADSNRITVRICAESGQLAGSDCPNAHPEEYLLGDQPLTRCSQHNSRTAARDKARQQEDAGKETGPDGDPPPDAKPPPDPKPDDGPGTQ